MSVGNGGRWKLNIEIIFQLVVEVWQCRKASLGSVLRAGGVGTARDSNPGLQPGPAPPRARGPGSSLRAARGERRVRRAAVTLSAQRWPRPRRGSCSGWCSAGRS